MNAPEVLSKDQKPYCDCCVQIDGVWVQRCDCTNGGDLASAESWCTAQNVKAPLLARIAELERGNENLRSVMIAAAEEIHSHWQAHCDAEGYGPANLMARLEAGLASEYAYKAGDFDRLRERVKELERQNNELKFAIRAATMDSELPPETFAAPIAKLVIAEDDSVTASLYAPGLPPGEHDVYPEAGLTHWDRRPRETGDMQPAVIAGVAVKNGRAVVLGIPPQYQHLPDDHPWHHNCDAMGCSSVEHVLWRGPYQDESTPQQARSSLFDEVADGLQKAFDIIREIGFYQPDLQAILDKVKAARASLPPEGSNA